MVKINVYSMTTAYRFPFTIWVDYFA